MNHLFKKNGEKYFIFSNEREFPDRIEYEPVPNDEIFNAVCYARAVDQWFASCTPPEGVEVWAADVEKFKQHILDAGLLTDPFKEFGAMLQEGIVIPEECFEVREFEDDNWGQKTTKHSYAFFRSPIPPEPTMSPSEIESVTSLVIRLKEAEDRYAAIMEVAEGMKEGLNVCHKHLASYDNQFTDGIAFVLINQALAKFEEFKKK
jgi:hypothetical protein